jgi:dihydrofolate reductase
MRKLILQEWLSLDGFAAHEDGSTTFFESPGLNEQSDDDICRDMDSIDTILMGANTYKIFVEYWPNADPRKDVIAEAINNTTKIVFSKSLSAAPWGSWPAAQIESKDAVEAVRKLKALPGKNMVLWGSISLAASLISAGLVDVYEFRIVPTALGKGLPFFRENTSDLRLRTTAVKQYPGGLVLLRYES